MSVTNTWKSIKFDRCLFKRHPRVNVMQTTTLAATPMMKRERSRPKTRNDVVRIDNRWWVFAIVESYQRGEPWSLWTKYGQNVGWVQLRFSDISLRKLKVTRRKITTVCDPIIVKARRKLLKCSTLFRKSNQAKFYWEGSCFRICCDKNILDLLLRPSIKVNEINNFNC